MKTVYRRALVVDGAMASRIALGRLLVDFGLSVVQAKTGAEAVRIYEEDPSFDLVVLDIDMPGMSGFSVGRLVRQHQRAKRPWIVGLVNRLEGNEKCSPSGIDLFVSKDIIDLAVDKSQSLTLIKGGAH